MREFGKMMIFNHFELFIANKNGIRRMKHLFTVLLHDQSYSFKKEEWEYFIKATSCFFVCLPHPRPHSLFCDVIRMRPI